MEFIDKAYQSSQKESAPSEYARTPLTYICMIEDAEMLADIQDYDGAHRLLLMTELIPAEVVYALDGGQPIYCLA